MRDTLFIVGVLTSLAGLWWLWPPVCLTVAGALLVWTSIRLTETKT